ncbi:MAG: Trk system potassium transporter TrkA [Zetaproteobacteria bacterium]|nr:MAG: Trk system potassium transporter TrkA [Zetaproteobacteria bacterium]
MNILILGAGEVGFHIARYLSNEGNNVTVIDNDAERLALVADLMDVRTVHGQASHPSVLERASAASADLLIAATTNDEVNMLACQVAHSLFRVPTKMARIRSMEYVQCDRLFGRDDLPIDRIISPETEAAKAVLKRVQVSSAADAMDFAGGRVQLLGIPIVPKSPLAGISLAEIDEVVTGMRVYVVAHEHNRMWRVPDASTVLLAGDAIYVAINRNDVDAFLRCIGRDQATSTGRDVMMIGGGNIGFIVARELEKLGVHLKLIEQNPKRAEWLAEHLSSSIIIQGDAIDQQLLENEAIQQMGDFLALTNDDETNILASLIARKYRVPHIVTLINRSIYMDLVREIGLDVTVSPRLTTVASILRHVRRGRVLGVSAIGGGELEVLEAEALETTPITADRLRSLRLPPDTVIGAVVRGEEVIIPNGETRVQPHDIVIIVTRREQAKAVERLFEVQLEFF